MSRDVQHGNIIFICDSCDDVLETNTSNWYASMSALRQNGWKPYMNPRDEWAHRCGRCDKARSVRRGR